MLRELFGSVVIALALSACADKAQTVTRERVSSGDPLLDKYASNHGYAKTGGAVRSQSDKKSEYAGKTFGGTKDFSGKSYATSQYGSKRWGGGDKTFSNKKYAGRTDGSRFKKSPEFVQQQNRYGDMKANAQGKAFGVASIGKSNARENSGRRLSYKESWYAKRNNVKKPIIIPWKQQPGAAKPPGLSVGDTKTMMGRAKEDF